MMHHLLLCTVLCASVHGITSLQASEKAEPKASPAIAIAWSHTTEPDGRNHMWDNLAIISKNGHVIAIDKSFDTKLLNGSFTLWEFDSEGSVLYQEVIDKRSPEMFLMPLLGAVLGIFPTDDDGLLIVGAIDGHPTQYSIIRLNRRKRVSAIAIATPLRSQMHKAIQRSDGTIVMVGTAYGAVAMAVALSGDILWTHKYDQESSYSELKDAAVMSNGEILLAGMSKDDSQKAGQMNILCVKCKDNGDVVKERKFSGRLPHLASSLEGDRAVLLYDTGQGGEATETLVGVDSDLVSRWERPADVSRSFAFQPAIARTNDNQVLVAGIGKERALCATTFDTDGQESASLTRKPGTSDGSLCVAGSASLLAVATSILAESDGTTPLFRGDLYVGVVK